MSLDLIRTFLLKSKASNRRSFLSDLFKTMDKDRSKRIDYAEFKNGLKALGLIDITDNEFRKLFIEFDSNKDGEISLDEFLKALKPGLTQTRIRAIDDAFKKLDVNNDGVLSIDDFRVVYLEQAKNHPKCLNGTWTVDEALKSFLDAFDTPGQENGVVTKDEFRNYYSIISAKIPDDATFVMFMNSSFYTSLQKGVPGGRSF